MIGTGFSPTFYKVSTPWMGGRSGQGGQWWTAVDSVDKMDLGTFLIFIFKMVCKNSEEKSISL